MQVKVPAFAVPSGVSTVTGVGPAVPGGLTTVIAVGDSERMMPGVDPNSTWSESGTKYDPSISTVWLPFVEPIVGCMMTGQGAIPIVADTIAVAQHPSTATSPGIQTLVQLLGSGTDRM